MCFCYDMLHGLSVIAGLLACVTVSNTDVQTVCFSLTQAVSLMVQDSAGMSLITFFFC